MRERLYVTTALDEWDEQECLRRSKEYKNVIIYSPLNKAVFLNSVRYGSINEISEINNAELFELSIDKYNLIHLTQRDYRKTFNKTFKYMNAVLNNGDTIRCHVNERIQIIANAPVNIIDNKQYHWTSSNNDIVVIDENNIITPKKISEKHSISLVNVNDPNDIQFTLNLKIFPESSILSTGDDEVSPYAHEQDYTAIDISHVTSADAANLKPMEEYNVTPRGKNINISTDMNVNHNDGRSGTISKS